MRNRATAATLTLATLSLAMLLALPGGLPASAETRPVTFQGIELELEGQRPGACVHLGSAISTRAGFRPGDYVEIEPKVELDATIRDGRFCLAGMEWGTVYTVTLRAGLPLGGETTSDADLTTRMTIPDAPASVGFAGNGYILARSEAPALPLVTRNVDAVELTVLRVVERNLIDQLREGTSFDGTLNQWSMDYLAGNDAEVVWRGTMEIEGERNRLVRTGVPLDDLIDPTEPGIHVVTASIVGATMEPWHDRATQWVLVTDLGLATFRSDDGLSVFVSSHATAAPVAGARVTLVARNNRILGDVFTNAEGRADFAPGLLKGEGGAAPAGLMARLGDRDFTTLSLSGSSLDLSDRGVTGREAPGPIDAFLYGDRDIYRPGETVHIAALIRDQEAIAIAGLPLALSLVRPDGQIFATHRPANAGAGLATTSFDLPRSAATGTWTAQLHVDPGAPPIASYRVAVEDFVPERLDLELTPSVEGARPGETVAVEGAGRFLFGAPAVRLEVTSEVVVLRDSEPFPSHPDFSFGLVTDDWSPTRVEAGGTVTDEDGRFSLAVALPDVGDTTVPLRAQVLSTLLEAGGRGVTRATDVKLRPRDLAVGIKPLFDSVGRGETVGFDVVSLRTDGTRRSGDTLTWELIHEDHRYEWFRVGAQWRYRTWVKYRTVDSGRVTSAAEPVRVQAAPDWGSYRLEVYDTASGAASSVRFRAGWWPSDPGGASPDRVTIGLDRDSYAAGDVARLRIDPPQAGTALLTVLGRGVLEARRFAVPKEGATIDLPVADDWGAAGAYVAVTMLHPGTPLSMPGRAVGITWLAIDRGPRTLDVAIGTPEKVRPDQTIDVPLTVSGLATGERAWLTLAAVDQGVLSLTHYETPDPAGHFFGQRRLAVELKDSYGRLIDPRSDRIGLLRSGGDAMGRQNQGLDVDAYETVALFSGAVEVGADGRVTVPLALPDFNGALRLMAVATSATKVGRGETELIVRAPLIADISRPRFLAPGDRATLALELHNVEAGKGTVTLDFSGDGAVEVGTGRMTLEMAVGETVLRTIDLVAEDVGVGSVSMTVTAPDGSRIVRRFELAVRPAQAIQSSRRIVRIPPGGRFLASADIAAGLRAETVDASLVVGAGPGFDLPRLVSSLYRYPYGCLEQTVSTTLPLLYLSDLSAHAAIGDDPETLRRQAQEGIWHLLTMQRGDGAFGLWSAYGDAEPWLTVYAVDFMTRARAAGFTVPDPAYDRALDWVSETLVKRGRELFDERAADSSRAYALYVLAAAGRPDPSAVRYWSDRADTQETELERALMAASRSRLGLTGGSDTVAPLLETVAVTRPWLARDYGSTTRDAAMRLSLMAEANVDDKAVLEMAETVSRLVDGGRYLSTQEMAWLTLAGMAMIERYGDIDVTVDGTRETRETPLTVPVTLDRLARGVTVENHGSEPVIAAALTAGVPTEMLPAEADGFGVTRRLHTLGGTPVAPGTSLRQGERYVLVVDGWADGEGKKQALLIDMLPAGLEIENERLTDGGSTASLGWVGETSQLVHREIRDDRFVAAIDLEGGRSEFKAAFMVRAITPGRFVWPAPYIEDMYRPDRFARGAVGTLDVAPR